MGKTVLGKRITKGVQLVTEKTIQSWTFTDFVRVVIRTDLHLGLH